VDMLLQRLLHEDECGRIGNCNDGSRCAFVRFDFGVGLLFNISAAVVGMLKLAPNFVLSRLPSLTYLPVRLGGQTPCGLAWEGARLGAPGDGGCDRGHFEHPVGNNLDSFLLIAGLMVPLLFV